nr:MAG TPA: hypothetical protein [Caudoviricetes sp.]
MIRFFQWLKIRCALNYALIKRKTLKLSGFYKSY